ncbi:MAG: ATP-binding protein [Bacteroidota bacterium]
MKRIATGFSCWRWCILVLFVLSTKMVSAQTFQEQIDSMLHLYQQTEELDLQVALLNEVAFTYRRVFPDSMLYYARLALDKALELEDDAALAYAYKNNGIGLYKLGGNPDSCIHYYKKAIDYAERAQDYYTQAACYNNIGVIKQREVLYNEAVNYFLLGVQVFDDHINGDHFLKALMLGNIATAHHRDGENQKGIPYYESSLAMAERIQNKTIPSIFVDELARARMEEGDLAGAERDILALMPLHDELGDYESKTETLITYAEVLLAKGNYTDAYDIAEQAYEIALEKDFTRNQAMALTRLAQASVGIGEMDRAVMYAQWAGTISEESEINQVSEEILSLLSTSFAQCGDYRQAYIHSVRQLELQARSQNVTKQRIADDLEAKYQNQQRLAEIERLNEERQSQQSSIYGLIALVLVILAVLVSLYYQYRQKLRATRALHQKNMALQQAEKNLSEKNQELERYIESNMQLENFAHLASHDLREPMRNIVSFSQLLQRSAKERLLDQEQEFLEFIVHGTERIEGLVKDLLAYSTVSNAPLTITDVDLTDLMGDLQNDLRQLIDETEASIEIGALPTQLIADRSRLYQLLQNLLTNAMRYRRQGTPPVISIQAEAKEDHYFFRVADNGIGIDPKYYDQIFMLFKSLNNKSVNNSSGIGLATAKRAVEDHLGQIWVEANSPQGSVFCFTLSRQLTPVT